MSASAGNTQLLIPWKNPNLYAMAMGDAICFVLAQVLAFNLRFDFMLLPMHTQRLVSNICYIVPLKIFIFSIFHLYRGMWRYTSLTDLRYLAQASLVATLVIALISSSEDIGFSRSIVLLDALLTIVLTSSLRVGIRSYFTVTCKISRPCKKSGVLALSRRSKRVLIIGAGDAGEMILREVLGNPRLRYLPVGLLDDDPRKTGRSVHGIPVLGGVDCLSQAIDKYDIQQVFVTIPSGVGSEIRRIIDTCKSCEVEYKILPGFGEIIDGNVSLKTIRELNYEDLLGRQPVEVDMTGIGDYITGRSVMVTGCGGSIGSELCRKLVFFKPENLILVDASEANLFNIQMELIHEFCFKSIVTILGKVQDRQLMNDVFRKYRPHVVFHAAACKHVPMLEINPWEAVFNNVLGSLVVMEMSDKYRVNRFVLVSTDKAVRPTNVMGASKRVAELLMHSFSASRTKYMAVRFGNVVGSSGSVIPIFRRQIERGGPVTVTHPDITRYFMTIPEAARLILQAGAMGQGGEVFILKMGTPVRIADVAKDLIRLSGKEPGKDIEIVYTGLREGEKIFEELITADEGVVATAHNKIMVIRSNGNGNGNGNGHHNGNGDSSGNGNGNGNGISGEKKIAYKNPLEFQPWVRSNLKDLVRLGMNHDGWAIKQKLNELVPEYKPQKTNLVI